ncbi:hypothetical protein F511_06325 [Dorcoceras hygrometricum]|uniref:Uncharacterized protein n=1 Tax=Dorcoceras hygrometricum TaxID=472368 RepID=A0A2Z7AXU2_9LAMI|nr:hypothetical protein F511_06325 [Dorcoceras hygrometricum]
MKSLSMAVSSPSRARAENFPPPLMRFVGSRSSGRPRASPMLMGKKNAIGVIETTQEPSSPKVTCFGQVSARRSANAKAGHRPWKEVDAREDSSRANSNQKCQKNDNGASADKRCSGESEVDGVKGESNEDFVFCPPKNALILTRCRSAPYRSSSLAARIWGTPFEPAGMEAAKTKIEAKTEQPPHLCPENAAGESRISHENSRKLENENGSIENNNQDSKGTEQGEVVRPPLLTRCRSEPARTGERLINPEQFLVTVTIK